MRQVLMILAILGAGLSVACSDDQSGQQGQSGDGDGSTELNVNTDDGSFSYKDKDGDSVSINEDKGGDE